MSRAVLMAGNSHTDADLYYKTHFLAGDTFVYLEHESRSWLVVPAMERGRAESESSVPDVKSFDEFGYREIAMEERSGQAAIARILPRIVRAIGAESACVGSGFSAHHAQALSRDGIDVEIQPGLLRDQRRAKSSTEIDAIIEAQRATAGAMRMAIDTIAESEAIGGALHFNGIPLTSERLRQEIEIFLLRHGMESPESPIVAGGPRAADPHWLGQGPLREGEAIVLDLFPRSRTTRYFADMTRTVVKGNPAPQMQAMYDAVAVALETAVNLIGPGVGGQVVHEAVVETFKSAGFDREGGPRYPHGTGHGVGLNVHEAPGINRWSDELRPGDVVTVEPGLYEPRLGAVRLEDMVVVTDEGCRTLTTFESRFRI